MFFWSSFWGALYGVIFDERSFYSEKPNFSKRDKEKLAKKIIGNINKVYKNSRLSSSYKFELAKVRDWNFTGGRTLASLTKLYRDNKASNKKAKLDLHILQQYYKLDLLIAIIGKDSSSKFAGIANGTPKYHGYANSADFGIVFINGYKNAKRKYVISHEMGHTFGLYHGKAVADYTGIDIHYKTNGFAKGANGFGKVNTAKKSNNAYTTLMSYGYLKVSKARANSNRYSDKTRKDCGYYHNEPCGDDNANAVEVLQRYAKEYGKRSEWYK
ncbi:MAG: Unknown protein [uncultured Sulfurovum sp.]|uniref:Uncharacterized protein n=1 Tax=uncultured Sulfurovum sp. TaxID=269237 RepID=A0A6S6S7C2_9BACT|nr:MAG: Unknown protein [uncultured Sulfurovum sp.]